MRILARGSRVVTLLAGIAVVALSGSPATAVSISVDGSISDWVDNAHYDTIYGGADPGNPAFTPLTGVSSFIEDGSSGSSGYVGPGYGGQNFDMEAMYAYYDSSNSNTANRGLYLAVVTGFDQSGVHGWYDGSDVYYPGDLFLNFGGNPNTDGYNLAIATSTHPASGSPYVTAGNAYTPVGDPWFTQGLDYQPGPSQIIPGENVANQGAIGFAYSDIVSGGVAQDPNAPDTTVGNQLRAGISAQYDNQLHQHGTDAYASADAAGSHLDWNLYDHNVIEVFLSEAWLGLHGFSTANGVTVQTFWTESCGNDFGVVPVTTSVSLPPEVPEPLTMVMLGCMGLGMLGARRIKHRKSQMA